MSAGIAIAVVLCVAAALLLLVLLGTLACLIVLMLRHPEQLARSVSTATIFVNHVQTVTAIAALGLDGYIKPEQRYGPRVCTLQTGDLLGEYFARA